MTLHTTWLISGCQKARNTARTGLGSRLKKMENPCQLWRVVYSVPKILLSSARDDAGANTVVHCTPITAQGQDPLQLVYV